MWLNNGELEILHRHTGMILSQLVDRQQLVLVVYTWIICAIWDKIRITL
jgi:hypothetical protein